MHRRGRSVSSRFLVLYWLPQEEPSEPRIGFAVPRAAGGAVERNRIKRRLREVWHERLDRVSAGPRLRAHRPAGACRRRPRRTASRGSASASTSCSADGVPRECRDACAVAARIGLVWLYRLTFGALFPTTCKYHPSCSEYAMQAVRKHGLRGAASLAGWRLLRCNPWSRGGFDPRPMMLYDDPDPQPARDRDAARPPLASTRLSTCRGRGRSSGLTVVVRMLLVPLTIKQIHSMQSLQRHAPR